MESIKKKILFVCNCNLNRSPTFQHYFNTHYSNTYDIRSCGVYYGYPYMLDEQILKWADEIFVMDMGQYIFISQHHNKYLSKVSVVGISDEYDTDSEKLLDIIKFWDHNIFKK